MAFAGYNAAKIRAFQTGPFERVLDGFLKKAGKWDSPLPGRRPDVFFQGGIGVEGKCAHETY